MKLPLLTMLLLALVWWLLSGHTSGLLLGLGAASVLFTAWLARRMDVIDHESHPLHMSVRLVRFWAWLAVQIVVSNVQVVRLILSPRLRIRPTVVTAQTRQHSDLGMAVLGNAITLTPGTVTMDLVSAGLVVHALTREGADEVERGVMDRRVPRDVEELD